VFPNTATVELDFSIIGWEKNDNRVDLTDFSLDYSLETSRLSRVI
jgi:hypothetical protein